MRYGWEDRMSVCINRVTRCLSFAKNLFTSNSLYDKRYEERIYYKNLYVISIIQ